MTGNSHVPMASTVCIHLVTKLDMHCVPSCTHVTCCFRLLPTLQLYPDFLAQPCAVWFRLFSIPYLMCLVPVSVFSIISPSGCIWKYCIPYKPVRYSWIQLVQISTRFFPPLLLSMASLPSDKYRTCVRCRAVTTGNSRIPMTSAVHAPLVAKLDMRCAQAVHVLLVALDFSPCSGYIRIPLHNLAPFDSVCFLSPI